MSVIRFPKEPDNPAPETALVSRVLNETLNSIEEDMNSEPETVSKEELKKRPEHSGHKIEKLADGLIVSPARRKIMGHFIPLSFRNVSLPFKFKSGWTAEVMTIIDNAGDADQIVIHNKDDEVFNVIAEKDKNIYVAPFRIGNKFYIAACLANMDPAIKITAEEYTALTGRSTDDFDCEWIEALIAGKEEIVVDSSDVRVYVAKKEGIGVHIKWYERNEFLLACSGIRCMKNVENPDLGRKVRICMDEFSLEERNRFFTVISESLGIRGHEMKGDMLYLNFRPLINDENNTYRFESGIAARLKETEDFREKAAVFKGLKNEELRDLVTKAYCYNVSLEKDGQSFAEFAPLEPAYARIISSDEDSVRLILPYENDTVLRLTKDEFRTIVWNNDADEYLRKFTPQYRSFYLTMKSGKQTSSAAVIDCDAEHIWVLDDCEIYRPLKWLHYIAYTKYRII